MRSHPEAQNEQTDPQRGIPGYRFLCPLSGGDEWLAYAEAHRCWARVLFYERELFEHLEWSPLTTTAKALRQHPHPHIAPLLELHVEADATAPYAAHVYQPGELLAHALRRARRLGQRLPQRPLVQAFQQIAEAAGHLHRHTGLTSRHFDPSRVHLTRHGAQLLALPSPRLAEHRHVLGRVGPVRSPRYLSPETARGLSPVGSSDVFVLCGMLWEALSGTHPIQAESDMGTLLRLIKECVDPQHPDLAEMPGGLREVLLRGLALDPAARYKDAAALAAALARALPPPRPEDEATQDDLLGLPPPPEAAALSSGAYEVDNEDPAPPPSASVLVADVAMRPCTMRWEELRPISPQGANDGEVRHCDRCDQPVVQVRDRSGPWPQDGRSCAYYAPTPTAGLWARLRAWWR